MINKNYKKIMKKKKISNEITKNFTNTSKKYKFEIENKTNRPKNTNNIDKNKSSNLLIEKKINSYRPPKKILEEESLTLLNIDDGQITQNQKNNENNILKNKENTIEEKTISLNKERNSQTSKNPIEYNLALAYSKNNTLDQLKRNSATPLSNINNLNSLYNQKCLLDLMKKKKLNINYNEKINENQTENEKKIKNKRNNKNDYEYNNYNFNCYHNYFCYYNFNGSNYFSSDNISKTEEELNEDDLNCRYTSSYRNRMINKLKVMPNKEICDDSLSELQNFSRSSSNKLNQYYIHKMASNKVVKERNNIKNNSKKNNKINIPNIKKENYPNLILKTLNNSHKRNVKHKISINDKYSITEIGNCINNNQNDISLTIKNITKPSSKMKQKFQNILNHPNKSYKDILKPKKIVIKNCIEPYNERKSIKNSHNSKNKFKNNLYSSGFSLLDNLIFLNKSCDNCEKFEKKNITNSNKILFKVNTIEKINEKSKYKNIFDSNKNDYTSRIFSSHQKRKSSNAVFNENNKYFSPFREKEFTETNIFLPSTIDKNIKNIASINSNNYKKKNEKNKKNLNRIFNSEKSNNAAIHIKNNTGLSRIKSKNSETKVIRKYVTLEKIIMSNEKNKKKIGKRKTDHSLNKNKEKRKLEIKYIGAVVSTDKETNNFPDKNNKTLLNISTKFNLRNKINYAQIFLDKNDYLSQKIIRKNNEIDNNPKKTNSAKKKKGTNKDKYTTDEYPKKRLTNNNCKIYDISNLIRINNNSITSSNANFVVNSVKTRSNKKIKIKK